MARFEIEVFTRFREEGIAQIGRRVRDELRQIAADRSLSPGQAAGRIGETRLGAERAVASLRNDALRGLQPGSQEYARIQAQFALAQRALTQAFREVEQGSTRLGREIQAILARAGAQLPGRAAVAGARANPLAPQIAAGVGGAREHAQVAAATQRLLAEDQEYVAATAAATRAKAQIAADVQRILAVDREYIEATAVAASARARSQASIQRALAEDRDYAEAQAGVASAKARQRAEMATILSADASYATAQVQAAREKARQNAQVQQTLAQDQEYIQAQAQATAARRQIATAIRAEIGAITGATDAENDAATALRARIAADRQATATARLMANAQSQLGQQAVRAAAERRIAEARVTASLHVLERENVRAAIATGEGTRFQRLLARAQFGGQNRTPTELPTMGQFIGSRAATTVGYGISGALLYGGVQAISEMIDEAEQLQMVMNQLDAQFESMREPPEAIVRVREELAGIARETGQNTAVVAESFRLLRGAFANTDEPIGATNVALRETRAAMQVAAVTGLDLKEVFDSLTATALSFETTITAVGDSALGLSERFGVPAREIIAFTADIAPIASQLGFTYEQINAIGAAAQRASGRSGASLGEAFSRILPQIQEVKDEILGMYQIIPALGGMEGAGFETVLQGFATGDIEQVFSQLLRDYDNLTQGQQAYTLELLGGRRETQALAAILRDSGPLLAEFDAQINNAGRDTGRLGNYFERLRETVSNTQARMSEVFRQLGESLFNAGLAEVLTTAANAAAFLGAALGLVLNIMAALNEATDGWIGRATAWVLVTTALVRGYQLLAGLIARKTVATVVDTAATGANVVAQNAEAAGSTRAATANVANAAALGLETRALTVNTGAQAANVFGAAGVAGVAGVAGARTWMGRAASRLPLVGGLLGAGVGAASLPVLALGGVAAAAVYGEYRDEQSGVRRAEEQFIEKLKAANQQELEEIASDSSSIADRIRSRLFGTELPENLARFQINRNRVGKPAEQVGAVVRAGNLDTLLAGISDQQFEEIEAAVNALSPIDFDINRRTFNSERIQGLIREAAEKGDPIATEVITMLHTFGLNNPATAALFQQAVSQMGDVDAAKAAGGFGNAASINIETARRQFEAGIINEAAFQNTYEQTIDRLRRLRAAGGQGGIGWTDADAERLAEAEQGFREMLLERVQNQLGVAERIRQLTGQNSAAATLRDLVAVVRGSVGGLDMDSRLELLPDVLSGLQDAFQEELDGIADPIERWNRAKAGFVIPDWVQLLTIQQQITIQPQVVAFLADAANAIGISVDEMVTRVATQLRDTNQTLSQITLAELDRGIAQLQSILADTSGLYIADEIDAEFYRRGLRDLQQRRDEASKRLAGARPIVEPGGRGEVDAAQRRNLEQQAQAEEERRREEAQRQAEEARRRAEEAQRAAEEAARARIDLLRAQAGKDPVRLAELQIQAANLAASQARNEADALKAEAERVNAMRELDDAQLDLFQSMQDYASAIAEVAGDSFGVASINLDTVRERLRVLTEQGFGHTAEANRLRAELVRAEGGLRDARFEDSLGDIEYLLELERISTGQAIEMLRAMMAIPTNTEEMIRNLERRIHQLQQDLSQDLQFNIPQEIQLPTLYEARRLAQTPQGQGYQDNRAAYNDNRHIEVTFAVSSDTDYESGFDRFREVAVEPAMTYGPRSSLYSGA